MRHHIEHFNEALINEIDYNSFSGVKKALALHNSLERLSEKGDTVALSILIDLKTAIYTPKVLTIKQLEVVELYFIYCMTQRQIAFELGISFQAVNERLNGAIKNIKSALLSGELFN